MRIKSQKDTLCRRFSALGFKQDVVHNLVNSFQKWIECSGPEWTISRLKDLKVYYIQQLAGNNVPTPPWVATNSKGELSGVFGKIIRETLKHPEDHRKVQRTLSALMVYSEMQSNQITMKQWKKFSTSVEKNLSYDVEVGMDKTFNINKIEWGNRHLSQHYSFVNWSLNESTREPIMASLIEGTGKTQKETPEEIANGFDHPLIKEYFYRDYFNKVINIGNHWDLGFDEYYPKLDNPTLAMLKDRNWDPRSQLEDIAVGKIGFIQEAGYKLRSVANPHRIFQFALNPLKEDLLKILKHLPSDATHRQEDGVEWAQEELKKNNSLSSVDLSDATNNFPLQAQTYMLKGIYGPECKEILNLFRDVSRSPWLVNDPETKSLRQIKWSVGQPLGLGPSFPSFAFSHHGIMWGVIAKYEGRRFSEGVKDFINYCNGNERLHFGYSLHYRILGDDIVMRSKFESMYKEVLTKLDIPVSNDKTITSNRLAEFASRVITPDEIFVQNKWRNPSDRNFLALAKNLGPTSIGILRSKQKKAVKLLCHAPEILGGLGWNPGGLSLQTRYAIYQPYLKDKEEKIDIISKEALAVKKIALFNGDNVAYTVNELYRNLPSQNNKTISSSDRKMTSQSIDQLMNIKKHSISVDENLPTRFVIDTIKRIKGDPRGATVLEFFQRKDVIDVLSSCNNDHEFVRKLVSEKPALAKELHSFLVEINEGKHSHLTLNSGLKTIIKLLLTFSCVQSLNLSF